MHLRTKLRVVYYVDMEQEITTISCAWLSDRSASSVINNKQKDLLY